MDPDLDLFDPDPHLDSFPTCAPTRAGLLGSSSGTGAGGLINKDDIMIRGVYWGPQRDYNTDLLPPTTKVFISFIHR